MYFPPARAVMSGKMTSKPWSKSVCKSACVNGKYKLSRQAVWIPYGRNNWNSFIYIEIDHSIGCEQSLVDERDLSNKVYSISDPRAEISGILVMVRRFSPTCRGTTYWFQYFGFLIPGILLAHAHISKVVMPMKFLINWYHSRFPIKYIGKKALK